MEQFLGINIENVGVLSFLLIVYFFSALLGFKIIFSGFKDFYKLYTTVSNGKASQHWECTEGKIIYAELIPSTVPEVKLKYSFNVNGQKLEGSRISFNEKYSNPNAPNSLINMGVEEKYPIGDNITVFYDKNNPSQSTLEKGIHILPLSINLALDAVIIIFWLFLLKIFTEIFYEIFSGLLKELHLL